MKQLAKHRLNKYIRPSELFFSLTQLPISDVEFEKHMRQEYHG